MENQEIARKIVEEFIFAMNEWEKQCNKIAEEKLSFEEEHQKQKELVEKIFLKFCTQKERKQSRPNTISYGRESSYEYDPNNEKIISIVEEKKSKIIVSTFREKPMEEKRQYIILCKEGNWLIDTKKYYSNWKQKWLNASL